MNYIQKLKAQRDMLIEFFEAWRKFNAAMLKFETTAYKGDARNEILRTKKVMEDMIPKIENEIINPERKEAVNG